MSADNRNKAVPGATTAAIAWRLDWIMRAMDAARRSLDMPSGSRDTPRPILELVRGSGGRDG